MRKRLLIAAMAALLLGGLSSLSAASGTDVIKEYKIDIKPQADGTLKLAYTIRWCVISNSQGPLTYMDVGLPNRNFDIVSFDSQMSTLEAKNSGSWSGVHAELKSKYNSGDCLTTGFVVLQKKMAHINDKKDVGFKYIPGWFDEIPVEHLVVTWEIPAQADAMPTFEPKPVISGNTAIWESKLAEGEKYTINVLYPQSAVKTVFPSFKEDVAKEEETDASTVILVIIIAIVVAIVIIVIIAGISSGDYGGGGYIGGGGTSSSGYRGGGSYTGGLSRPSGGSSSPSRSGGGGGSFGGRGSSCACVSCACACACAGGGRVGCSQKGFYIPLPLSREEVSSS